MKRFYCYCIFVFQILSSQEVKFERFGIEHGLSQSTVMSIVQDKEGFLWFGTWDGLNRYDGYTFVHYRHDPSDSNSLSNNSISRLFEDHDGDLWISTSAGGLNRFDKKHNRFQRFFMDSTNERLRIFSISNIFQDSLGYVWVANNSTVTKIDPKTSIAQQYNLSTIPSVPYSREESRNGFRFIIGKRLFTILQRGNILAQELFPNAKENEKPVDSFTLFEDRQGTTWVSTRNSGVFEYDWSTHTLVPRYFCSKDPKSLSSNISRFLFEDSRGTVWIGTEFGLNKAIRDKANHIVGFKHILHDPNNMSSINSDESNCMVEDRSGVLWIGTKIGLNKILPKRKNFQTIPSSRRIGEMIRENFPVAIFEESDSLLWIGSTGDLYQYNPERDDWKTLTPNNSGLSSFGIHVIHPDRNGTIWVATRNGLNKYDKTANKFIPILFDQESPYRDTFNRMYAIAEDSDGILWIGTAKGIIRYDPKKGTNDRIFFDTVNTGQGNTFILSLLADGEIMWVGTNNQGLLKLKRKDLSFQRFSFEEKNIHSLSDNKPMSIYKDRMGTVWIATLGGGLNKVYQEKDSVWFNRYQTKEGMSNDYVYGIVEDDDNNLWLSTNTGISKFNTLSEKFTNYMTLDGLPTLEFNQNSYHRGKSGIIYFGGVNGLVRFHPNEIGHNTIPPKIAITDFTIFNDSRNEKLSLPEIILSNKENFFSFEFASLCFETPEKNLYAYKLEGLDHDWNYIGTRRFASFTNIEPGEYIFRVKGSNNDGVWNEEGTSVKITIVPPFWATVWFRSLSLFSFFALIIGGVRYSAYRKYRRQIGELEQQKKILEERQRTRDTIARDLHDDLASTVGSAGLFVETAKRTLGDNSVQTKEYLDKTSSILNEAEEAMSDIVWSVSPKHDTLQSLVTRIRLVTTDLCRAHGIGSTVTTREEIDIPLSDEIRRGVYLIFKEVLNNCLKHSKASVVEVCIGIEIDHLVFRMKDNGTGFSMNTTTEKLGGNGMSNIRKRAEEIGAEITIHTVVGEGTEISLKKQITQLGH